jgi:Rrf2 family protein
MLSKKVKYALKAVVYIAKQEEGWLLISDIADKELIPKKFLEQILLELRKHTLLHSRRGKDGGYKLAKKPSEITMGQIIRIIDGPLAQIPCVSKLYYQKCEECIDEVTCTTRSVMQKVRDASAEILDNTTIQDLVDGKNYASL